MIVYDSKKWIWFFVTILKTFRRSYNLRQMLRLIMYSAIYTTVVTFLSIHYINHIYHIDTVFFSLIGVILSLFLVFRMNTSYDRWWQGRQAWGKLVNESRTLALHINTQIPESDARRRKFFVQNISNFCMSLAWHLRDDIDRAEFRYDDEEYNTYTRKARHIPNRIASYLFNEVELMYREKLVNDFEKLELKRLLHEFIDVLGICERIKKSPIPFSHSTFIKMFIITYLLILPFGLVDEFQYLTIPCTIVMSFAMIGIEVVSEEIENPFGLDANDLPTEQLSMTITENVGEILNQPIDYDTDFFARKEADIVH